MSRRVAYPELAAELARRGLNYQYVASRAGCSTGTIGQVVHGHLQPTANLQERIARALERPVDELFRAVEPQVTI
jgi:transcriptional regulator with XRE-family HTH domain